MYRSGVKLRKEAFGDQDPRYAAALAKLAGIHDARGEGAKAEQLYLDALKITEASLGGEHPQTANILACLGEIAVVHDDKARADSYLQRAYPSLTGCSTLRRGRNRNVRSSFLRNTVRTYLDKYLALAAQHPELTKEAYRF